MALEIILNGQRRTFEALTEGASIFELLADLKLKTDRVAVELNGEITPRSAWTQGALKPYDRLELVHFVGGGIDA